MVALGFIVFSSAILVSREVPWGRSLPSETPWATAASYNYDETAVRSNASLSRKERRENFFRSLEPSDSAGSASLGSNPYRELDNGAAPIVGVPSGDEEVEGSNAISNLPWKRFEEQGDLSADLQFNEVFLWPIADGKVSSGYGVRGARFHEGIDIRSPQGTPVRAANDGRVVYAGWISGYGKTVVIYHGSGVSTVYAHNSRIQVEVGDKVKMGQTISAVGRTGRTSGAHLHFEVRKRGRPQNPFVYSYSRVGLAAR